MKIIHNQQAADIIWFHTPSGDFYHLIFLIPRYWVWINWQIGRDKDVEFVVVPCGHFMRVAKGGKS